MKTDDSDNFNETPDDIQNHFRETVKTFRTGLMPLFVNGIDTVHWDDCEVEDTTLGGIAIKVATWNGFDVYVFLDNPLSRRRKGAEKKNCADTDSNYWFGFYHASRKELEELIRRLPYGLKPDAHYSDDSLRKKGKSSYSGLPLTFDEMMELMKGRLTEYYYDEFYYGVWDLAGTCGANVNIARGIKFIADVVRDQQPV